MIRFFDIIALLAAVGFFVNALHHQLGNALCAAALLIVAILCRVVDSKPTPTVPEAPAHTPELIGQWLVRVAERAEIAHRRLAVGLEHGHANRQVVLLEEELMLRFGGQAFPLEDGRIVTIGRPGCRIADRVRVNDSTTAAIARMESEGLWQ